MARNVIDLIMADHRDVEAIFEKLRKHTEDRPALLAELAAKFTAHARAEETKVYPELVKVAPREAGEVHHGVLEHHEAEELLAQVMAADVDGPQFEKLLEKLIEAVEHHVQEEESDILSDMAKSIPAHRLQELARIFSAAKAAELGTPPKPVGRSRDELLEQAEEAGVEGYRQMNKDELAAALEK